MPAIIAFVVSGIWVSTLTSRPGIKETVWLASWGASQQIPEPQNALAPDDLRDDTVRQIFHLSAGGPAVRVHVSNAFGTEALHFTSVHIARAVSASSPAIDVASDRALTFTGSSDVTVPPGAEFVSDPLEFAVTPLADVAVTFTWNCQRRGKRGIRDHGPRRTTNTETR